MLVSTGSGCRNPAGSGNPEWAWVARLQGKVFCSTDAGGTWNRVHLGEALKPGAELRTEHGASAEICVGRTSWPAAFARETRPVNYFYVQGDSTLRIDSIATNRQQAQLTRTELCLLAGGVVIYVKNLPAGSSHTVSATNCAVSCQGGVYGLRAGGFLRVLRGEATVKSRDQSLTRTCGAGEGFDVATQAPIVGPSFLTFPDFPAPLSCPEWPIQ